MDEKYSKILRIIILTAVTIYIFYNLFSVFNNISNIYSKIFIIVFSIIALLSIITAFARLFDNYTLEKILSKTCTCMVLVLWFGVIGYLFYKIIEQKSYAMLLVLIPFTIFGIYSFYIKIIKK